MFCPNCGKELNENEMCCPNCGKQYKTEETFSQNNEMAFDSNKKKYPKNKPILNLGVIFSFVGVGIFLMIVFLGLIIYGEVYLLNGYSYTMAFCIISLILMVGGAVLASVGLVMLPKKQLGKRKFVVALVSVFAVVASIIAFSILAAVGSSGSSSSSSSAYSSSSSSSSSSGSSSSGSSSSGSSSSGGSSSTMSHSTYCLLYMDVYNVVVSHKGNYTYVSGTIKNTGTYQIKYVKVKAVCKSYSGKVIDTDWTYAVDSTWLDPNESKKFEMMIRDEKGEIKTADVTVVID